MRFRVFAPLFLLIATFCSAQDQKEHVWTGVNGKTFRGSFHRFVDEKKKAEFFTADGKLLKVAIENLSPADRERLLNPPAAAPQPVAVDPAVDAPPSLSPAGFRTIPDPPRQMARLMVPEDFGGEASGTLLDAVWTAFVWWDSTQVVAIPSRGDAKDKARWLHKKMSNVIETTGVSAEDAQKGIEKYFAAELKETAACRVKREQADLSPPKLSEITGGTNAVVLRMSMTYASGGDYSVNTFLESMTPEGEFSMILCGTRLTGHAKPLMTEKGAPVRNSFEFAIENRGDLPPLFIKNGAQFFIGNKSWNTAIFITPFVYAIPAKPPEDAKTPRAKGTL